MYVDVRCEPDAHIDVPTLRFGKEEIIAMDDALKRELLDKLNAEMNVKKESKDARFDSSTGTLYNNSFRNYAVAHVDTDNFTKGKVYEGGEIINGRMQVIDDHNRPANIDVADYDFEFRLHVIEK